MTDYISPARFRQAILVNANGSPTPLVKVMDPWQKQDFEALDPAWERIAGMGEGGPAGAWLGRARGHSKTTDQSIMACWIIAYAQRPVNVIVAAADKDQAGLLRKAALLLLRMNPWLGKLIKVQADRIINEESGSELLIISNDVASSWGHTPDAVICDELTTWRNEELWHSLFSSAAKVGHSFVAIMSNAGTMESWQYRLLKEFEKDEDWYVHELPGPVASWLDPKQLRRQSKLPKIAFDRLWMNIWSAGSGDAFTTEELTAITTLEGPWAPSTAEDRRGKTFIAALDIGTARDNSALVVLSREDGWIEEIPAPERSYPTAVAAAIDLGLMDAPYDEPERIVHHGDDLIRLVDCQIWKPSPGEKVSIEDIFQSILRLHGIYGFSRFGFDPHQGLHLAERLRAKGLHTFQIDFIGKNLKDMASLTLEAISERKLLLYHQPELIRDLKNIRVAEKSYGFRLESPRDEAGHGDAATALQVGLLTMRATHRYQRQYQHRDLVIWPPPRRGA